MVSGDIGVIIPTSQMTKKRLGEWSTWQFSLGQSGNHHPSSPEVGLDSSPHPLKIPTHPEVPYPQNIALPLTKSSPWPSMICPYQFSNAILIPGSLCPIIPAAFPTTGSLHLLCFPPWTLFLSGRSRPRLRQVRCPG